MLFQQTMARRLFVVFFAAFGLLFAELLNQLFLDRSWNGTVTSEFHGESRFTLSFRAKVSRVTEHLTQRNFSQDNGIGVTHIRTQEHTAAGRKVTLNGTL